MLIVLQFVVLYFVIFPFSLFIMVTSIDGHYCPPSVHHMYVFKIVNISSSLPIMHVTICVYTCVK